jgi:hypothetical protein
MIEIDDKKFEFIYLPDYAAFLLKEKLVEFVTVGIRFMKEAEFPLLKPLSRFSEEELVNMGLESNRLMLKALSENKVFELIRENSKKWIENTMGILDKDDISAEDLSLGYYLRRKLFAHFLDAYTKNVVEQKFIIAEVDTYTTREEIHSYNLFLRMQQDKFEKINKDLVFYKQLLLEAQEFGEMGSFSINFKDPEKNIFTPEYKKILGIDDLMAFEKFYEFVHPEDRELLQKKIETAYKNGGHYEMEYRYKNGSREKKIWSKGYVISENGRPALIRGTIRDITAGK